MAGSRYAGGSRYTQGSKYAQGSRFAGAERGGGANISETVPVLEREVAASGAPVPAQDSPGLFRRALDLISRPNYAVAGAAEELFSPQGGGLAAVPGRVGSELFSGIGNIKGQKEGFGQVMEQSGVGPLGHLSGILPEILVHTPGGPALLPTKGSPLDVTGRGAIGLGLDIAADPLTYVNPSKVIAKIPGVKAAGAAAKSTIKSVPAFDKALDAVGGVFKRDWKIRNLPGAIRLKQAHLNRQNYETALLHDALGNSAVAAIPKGERAAFVDAIDQGTWAEKYKDSPKMLEAAKQFKQFNNGFAINEVEHGLLDASSIREDYAAHFYDNSAEELNKVMSIWPGRKFDKATLGRHKELRAFYTLEQAEKWSKAQHAIDPAVPILKPVRDPLEILKRRGEASLEAIEWNKFNGEIVDAFGRKDLPFKAEDYFDLTKAIPVQPHEADAIDKLLAAGKTSPQSFAKLSAAGKQEFMRGRLLKTTEQGEVLNVLKKYGIENAPKQKQLLGKLAEDGTPYKQVNIGGNKVELPQSMVEDLTDMSERTLRDKNTGYLLNTYDRINNVFKSFVTVLFPAFHFRNAYSNVAQSFADVGLAYLNPQRHLDAIDALRGAEGSLVTKAGEHIPYRQLQQEMAQNGVTTTGRRVAEYTGQAGIDRLSTTAGKVKAAPRAVGGLVENEARAALYTVHRRRGLDAASAAEQVNKALFDYTNLSAVEQKFFRRVFPFYTWTRKNIEQQFRNLATKPGLTAAEIKPFRGREDENGQMTSWDAEALKVRLNRDGKTLRILSGVDLPIKGLDFIWNGSIKSTLRQGIGMLSPIAKAPLELGLGVNAFTGKEMGRQQSNAVGKIIETLDPPKAVQDWVGYKKEVDKAGRPQYTFDGQRFYVLFQSWALSRLVSTSDRQFKTFTESPEWSKIMLDVMTGLRDKEVNLDEEQAKRMAERKRQLEESLVRWGQRREFNRTYKPK